MMDETCCFCNTEYPVANHLSSQDIEKLKHSSVQVSFSKGDVIFKQNALSSNIIFITKGLVKLHLKGPAHEQIIKISKGPCFLGLPTTFGDKVNNYSATAITEVKACFIDINIFKDLISCNSKFAYEIIVELSKNELNHFRRCLHQTQKQSPGRLADALLYFSNKIFLSDTFTMPLTQSEIGDLTSSSRENISRLLRKLDEEKIIQMQDKKIRIVDKLRLEQISRLKSVVL